MTLRVKTSALRLREATVFFLVVAGVQFVTAVPTWAQRERTPWSVSTNLAVHHPQLHDLNANLYRSPFMGRGATGQANNTAGSTVLPDQEFRFDMPLPAVGNGAKAGIMLQWRPNETDALFFGLGSWEKTSIVRGGGEMPTEAQINLVNIERRGKISYTEYSLGWRHFFWRQPKFNFFASMALHEMFDLDYREDHVVHYLGGAGRPDFRRIHITEAQSAALLMGQLSLGGEWFLRDWFSLGFEGGYLLGYQQAKLHDVRSRTDYGGTGDRVTPFWPAGTAPDGTLGYLPHDVTISELLPADHNPAQPLPNLYRPVELEFQGWQVAFNISIYI